MPFPQQGPKSFDRPGIGSIASNQKGVYGLFKENAWVYIGKADDLRKRLLEHLNGDDPCITRESPTHFVTSVVAIPDAEEKRLIFELGPTKCNARVG
jgi:hypothetical protein